MRLRVDDGFSYERALARREERRAELAAAGAPQVTLCLVFPLFVCGL